MSVMSEIHAELTVEALEAAIEAAWDDAPSYPASEEQAALVRHYEGCECLWCK